MQKVLVSSRHPEEPMLAALRQAGFDTTTASDGSEGMRTVYTLHPDDLPPIGGRELHSRIREACLASIIIIGQKGEFEWATMIEEGADLYLNSSVTYVGLIARLHCLPQKRNHFFSTFSRDVYSSLFGLLHLRAIMLAVSKYEEGRMFAANKDHATGNYPMTNPMYRCRGRGRGPGKR